MRYVTLALALACAGGVEIQQEKPGDFEIRGRAALRVRVGVSDDTPVSGAWVTLHPGGRDAYTSDEGTAQFLNMSPGDYEIVVNGDDVMTARVPLSVELADKEVQITVVSLAEEAGIVLRVLGPNGAAVYGATVVLDDTIVGVTDIDGHLKADAVSAGRHELQVLALSQGLGRWSTRVLDVPADQLLQLNVALPGAPPDNAEPIGAEVCAACHEQPTATWRTSRHARTVRTPKQLADDGHPMSADVHNGVVVDTIGGTVALRQAGEGWMATVRAESGRVVVELPVAHTLGGHASAAALIARQADDSHVVLPIGWSSQDGWVAAWTGGWATDGALGSPDVSLASYELGCAGCHTTGGTLVEDGGTWRMASDGVGVEDGVACEACHGNGSYHRRDASRRKRNIVHPGRLHGAQQVEVCAGCHSKTASDAHPFSERPGWPVTEAGARPMPTALWSATSPDRRVFAAIAASKVSADQAGDLLAGPHHNGNLGYEGSCSDCHVAHGSPQVASLRTGPLDNDLCVGCHTDLDGLADQAEHAAHERFSPGPLAPGACVSCHMPRTAPTLSRDAITGVGQHRAHTMAPFSPWDVLADFDAAGQDSLGPGEVAVPGCMDCHESAADRLRQLGVPFVGPQGDPYYRVTYENLGRIQDEMWGGQ